MNKRNKLSLQMSLLFFVVFVFFGVIIVTDKTSPLLIPKITKKIENYIDDNYKDIKDKINIENILYEDMKFKCKITSKDNNKLYFYIYYQEKKITDTYENDYLKGKTLLNYQKAIIEQNIKKKTNNDYKVNLLYKLNELDEEVINELLTTNHPENLNIYSINIDVDVYKFDNDEISQLIIKYITNMNNQKIYPENYIFKITNKETKTKLKISNITNKLIENDNFDSIINDIIAKKKNNLLSTYNITYEYIN